MKLGASINLWDGEELLDNCVLAIRKHVDYLSIIFQKYSYYGNPATETMHFKLKLLLDRKLVDEIIPYSCNSNLPANINELNKRNHGLLASIKAGCTHHLSLDVDEFYKAAQFEAAKEFIEKNNYDSSFCRLYTYYKNDKYILNPIEDYFCPFIYKIRNDVWYNDIVSPVFCDPTRRQEAAKFYIFHQKELMMHHYSYVRNDLSCKLENSSAKVNFKPEDIDRVVEYYNKWRYPKKALLIGKEVREWDVKESNL